MHLEQLPRTVPGNCGVPCRLKCCRLFCASSQKASTLICSRSLSRRETIKESGPTVKARLPRNRLLFRASVLRKVFGVGWPSRARVWTSRRDLRRGGAQSDGCIRREQAVAKLFDIPANIGTLGPWDISDLRGRNFGCLGCRDRAG